MPATVSTTGIALSDLHIYIVADTTSPSISEEPFGVACSWLPTGMFHPDRPNFGIIKFPLTEINNLK